MMRRVIAANGKDLGIVFITIKLATTQQYKAVSTSGKIAARDSWVRVLGEDVT